MPKKTILHIIYNLGRGGAETMLVKVIKELSDYNNVVVTLFPQNHFTDELVCDKYYSLNIKSILLLPFSVFHLKKIIKKNKVDIVHTHLFWPTILARMATPKNVTLITTIHAFIANSIEYKKWHIRFLDRITYGFRKNIIITVADGALSEYFKTLKVKPYKAYALHTFADVKFFNNKISEKQPCKIFKLVTVGALRKQKNQQYLLNAFEELDPAKFQLDIFGEGILRNELEEVIAKNNLNVKLMGEVKNIQEIIPSYDLFVMSSTYEGFSLSVLEAMALRMPVMLSDIKSFREQCENTAIYFDLADTNDFVLKLQSLASDKNRLSALSIEAHDRVINNFTLEKHMEGLRKIYLENLPR